MAPGGGHKASAPWHACVFLHVLSYGEHSKGSHGIPAINSEDEEAPVKNKKGGALFPSSVSAQDLRCFDTENEDQDGSSPREIIEARARSFNCVKGSLKTNYAESETCSNSRTHSSWTRFLKLLKKKSVKRLASFPPLAVPKPSKRKSRSTRENVAPALSNLYNFRSSLREFTLSELQTATNNFSHENIIGRGGYADVYKGCLQDGQLIAVKRLSKGTMDEMIADFLSELGVIAHVHHPNTAKLIGCGVEGGMHLVFQLSKLGSLGSLLHGSEGKVDWSRRYKIALGIADGLVYLHENCERRIIHRDIKADNILLTEDFEAQICDFGLAKWLPSQLTHHNVSKFEGTFGYFAPEYFMHGIVDEKTDVYAFGVLLLELITGRQALDDSQKSLVIWAKPLLDNNNIKELVDPSLGDDYDSEEMNCAVLTAALCIEQSAILRPLMSQVVVMLRSECAAEFAQGNQRRTLQRTYSEELLDAQEYNSTRYLSDLNRHRQIALGA